MEPMLSWRMMAAANKKTKNKHQIVRRA